MSRPQSDDGFSFSYDDSQGPVQKPSIFESICVGILIGLFAIVVIVQVVR